MLQLVGTLILTRFIAPDDYGAVITASIAVMTAGVLTSFAFGQYLIAKQASPDGRVPGAGRPPRRSASSRWRSSTPAADPLGDGARHAAHGRLPARLRRRAPARPRALCARAPDHARAAVPHHRRGQRAPASSRSPPPRCCWPAASARRRSSPASWSAPSSPPRCSSASPRATSSSTAPACAWPTSGICSTTAPRSCRRGRRSRRDALGQPDHVEAVRPRGDGPVQPRLFAGRDAGEQHRRSDRRGADAGVLPDGGRATPPRRRPRPRC